MSDSARKRWRTFKKNRVQEDVGDTIEQNLRGKTREASDNENTSKTNENETTTEINENDNENECDDLHEFDSSNNKKTPSKSKQIINGESSGDNKSSPTPPVSTSLVQKYACDKCENTVY